MLVVTRKVGEVVLIGEDIRITVVEVRGKAGASGHHGPDRPRG